MLYYFNQITNGKNLIPENCFSYETADKDDSNQMPKAGFKKVGNNIVTKHDRELSERNNGKRIMEFPPGIETGDGGGTDTMQLSNAVYNK